MENRIYKFDDHLKKAIEAGQARFNYFFEFRSEIIKLCEKYEDKLEIGDICFILENIAMRNPPNDWSKKK